MKVLWLMGGNGSETGWEWAGMEITCEVMGGDGCNL